ncbi:MAG: hypothetical protein ACQEW8_03960 [Actinomycetota bacterium]
MPRRALLSLVVVGAVVLGGASPALAAPVPVSDWETLAAEASASGVDSPVVIDADIAEPGEVLAVERTLTLDLSGNALDVLSVKISAGATLTITDSSADQSGELTADASSVVPTPPPFEYTPGINVSDGALVIDSGRVTATGGVLAAGIGGGDLSDSGPITINGGVVTATSGDFAAGIGGGNGGSASEVTINGGDITATSTDRGAGIGGGFTGSGGDIVITGGTVTATGGERGSGIGDGNAIRSNDNAPIPGSDIAISGGDITAQGGMYAAGIGGGFTGSDVTVTVSGGTVDSTGGPRGAGIGTGQQTGEAAATVTLSGGQTTATGGEFAAAVGGGYLSAGGATVVGPDALLTTMSDASRGASAFGSGDNPTGLAFGSVLIEGTVELASGNLLIPDTNPDAAELTLSETGRLNGSGAPDARTLAISGTGQVANNGAIAAELTTAPCVPDGCTPGPIPTIVGNDYLVSFDPSPSAGDVETMRLLAPTFDSVEWDLPAAPSLTQWSSIVGGEAEPFTTATPVTDDITLTAMSTGSATIEPETAIAGDETTFTVVVRDADDAVVTPDDVVLTSSNPDDTVDGLTVTSTSSGSRTITASINGGLLTATATLEVSAAAADTLMLTPEETTVPQGSSVDFTVTAEDAFGNEVDISGVVLSSSVSTDVVEGLTVRFPEASPHVITASLDDVSASVTIEVEPSGTPSTGDLAATGPAPFEPIAAAALLLVLAGIALALRRKQTV